MEAAILRLNRLEAAPLVPSPFPHLLATEMLSETALNAINGAFPPIASPGLFPLDAVQGGAAFNALIDEIGGAPLRGMLAAKFGLALDGLPQMITVRGHAQRKDGRIHTDSQDKVLTCLLYLNRLDWPAEGGRLRLLRKGDDLESTIAEVPPLGGTLVAFQRTACSWHGHAPFEGPRRYVMFNWVRSEATLQKNLARHRVSAWVKRLRGK